MEVIKTPGAGRRFQFRGGFRNGRLSRFIHRQWLLGLFGSTLGRRRFDRFIRSFREAIIDMLLEIRQLL